jgi:hypothetical protein
MSFAKENVVAAFFFGRGKKETAGLHFAVGQTK